MNSLMHRVSRLETQITGNGEQWTPILIISNVDSSDNKLGTLSILEQIKTQVSRDVVEITIPEGRDIPDDEDIEKSFQEVLN